MHYLDLTLSIKIIDEKLRLMIFHNDKNDDTNNFRGVIYILKVIIIFLMQAVEITN